MKEASYAIGTIGCNMQMLEQILCLVEGRVLNYFYETVIEIFTRTVGWLTLVLIFSWEISVIWFVNLILLTRELEPFCCKKMTQSQSMHL